MISRKTLPVAARSTRTLLVAAGLLMIATTLAAQVSEGGLPYSFQKSTQPAIHTIVLPPVDVPGLLAEDRREAALGLPFRFGYPIERRLDMTSAGTWSSLPDGGRLWRLRLVCPGAHSVNLVYDAFWLPRGARFFLYNDDESSVLGAFTHRNNKPHGKFATGPTRGDACTLEYHEPPGVAQPGRITIARIIHGYRNVFDKLDKSFGDSGACNVNVQCPEGAAWEAQIRSVAMILTGGGWRLCSGALVNNVRNDLAPYFLTANHCLGGEETWVIMFNYQSSSCADLDGPTTDTVSGTTLLANNWDSDVALLRLSEDPPPDYHVHFAGWSAVDSAPAQTVCIHHPSGDIKKITFDNDPPVSTTYGGTPAHSHWKTVQYELGTTEPGSSGSPLFDDLHRVIGQLHGGTAACNGAEPNDQPDYYGKFALSWDNGATAAQRLRDWLDPDNTGATTLDGIDAVDGHAPVAEITAPAPHALLVGLVTISATATDDVGVTQVEFFIDDVSIGVDTAAPYAAEWDTTAWADGTHTIRATATDTDGLRGRDWIPVTLANYILACAAQAAPAAGVAPLEVTFSASVSGGEDPYDVAWDFGDGSDPVAMLETVHIYEHAGTYHWVFTAQDALAGRTRCEGDVLVSLPPADAAGQVIAAHVTRLPGWTSQIVLTNTGDTPVTPHLYALAADGTHLATATLHELPARAHADLTPDALFPGIPAATDFWVLVADAPRIEGVTVFGTDDGQSLVTMPLLRGGDTALVFPFVYISDIYYTGLTLVNPGSAAVTARLIALAESGDELAAIDVVIPARGKYVRLLDGIFPDVEPILIRFVAVSAERELVGFELFGSFVDQGLAGLPAVLMTPLTGPPLLRDIPPAADSVAKPTGFQGWGISDTAVRLRWDANGQPGVHYVIYRKNGMYTTEVGETESTAFTVTGLETGRTYTFLMKAVDGIGTFSAYSRQIRVAPLPSGQTDWPYRLFYGAVPDPARYYTGVTFSVSGADPVTAHTFIQDAGGLVLAEAAWPAAPGEQITRELPVLFGQAEIPGAACLRVGADVPLTGFSLYMTRPGLAEPYLFDGAPACPWGSYGLIFPMIPDEAGWTGVLRLTSLAGLDGTFAVSGYDRDGTLMGVRSGPLAAGSQFLLAVDDLFPDAPSTPVWLRVSADQPVIGQLLFVSPDFNRLGGYAGIATE